ncbi:MAG: hypothetical protein JSS82_15495 [Bacteroidetes bacterium]|nr:hypothetical protein [Bacteroidota bacterium]
MWWTWWWRHNCEDRRLNDEERIRNLEEKIQRQRADLARMYRGENEYIDRLKEELSQERYYKDMWHERYKIVYGRLKNKE